MDLQYVADHMPANPEAERLVLGACLLDAESLDQTINLIEVDDFSEDRHRQIYASMVRVSLSGIKADRVTVANDLISQGKLETISITYLATLDDGMPRIHNLESYIGIVRHKSTLRKAIKASLDLIYRCQTDNDDSGALAETAERIGHQLQEGSSRFSDMPKTVGQIVADEGGLDKYLTPETVKPIPIPFEILNATLDGLRRAKLILLAARPGVGKTCLLAQLAESTAAQGYRALVISKEMKGRDLTHRSLCGRANISAYKFRKGHVNAAERKALMHELHTMIALDDHLLIYDNPDCTVQKIDFMLRRLASQGTPVDAVFIDYVQILDAVGQHRSRHEELAKISKHLVRLKNKYDIPFVVLSQLNREGDADKSKDDKPRLKHVAEADQLVRDADSILLMWLSQKQEEMDAMYPDNPLQIINWEIPKNRDGIKNRGGLDKDGNNKNGLVFVKKQVRFQEDYDVLARGVAA